MFCCFLDYTILTKTAHYRSLDFILFLENYVQCKEIVCYFSLKSRGGGVCNKMGGGSAFNEKFTNWGGGGGIVVNGNG